MSETSTTVKDPWLLHAFSKLQSKIHNIFGCLLLDCDRKWETKMIYFYVCLSNKSIPWNVDLSSRSDSN
jgi:hypothetical protein